MDTRLKYLDVTAKYVLTHSAFGYPNNAVICVLVKGQYLLMPEGSLAQTIASFSTLPDDLKLRVPGSKRIEVGHLRQSIREAALNRPEVPALGTWTEIMPSNSDHYQLITSEDELVRMWIERYLEDSKIGPAQSFAISLSDIVLPFIDYDRHDFTVMRENLKFTGTVKLWGDSSLYSVYWALDDTNWVWSPSMGKLFRGSPGLYSLPGYRD